MSCDVSGYGACGVLFHRVNGSDKPIAFARSTLSKYQTAYCIITT